MRWIVLVISAVFEAVWATALGYSHGFTQPVPVLVFAVGVLISVVGLAFAMKTISVGAAYSVWVGIGAALTVAVAMFTGAETVSPLKVLFIVGIIGCVIGLKLVHADTLQADCDNDPQAAESREQLPQRGEPF